MGFKIGDRVQVIGEEEESNRDLIGRCGTVVSMTRTTVDVDLGIDVGDRINSGYDTTMTYYPGELKLITYENIDKLLNEYYGDN